MNQIFHSLFRSTFNESPSEIVALKAHASNRKIFRIRSQKKSVIGVFSNDINENRAFIGFSKYFKSQNLPVPEVYAVHPFMLCYLEEDLGDKMLLDVVLEKRGVQASLSLEIEELYKQALSYLVDFQVAGSKPGFDLSLCYQGEVFDQAAMLHDLFYFERCFLNNTTIHYNQSELHGDFDALVGFLSNSITSFFMYRDFQARNIMVRNGRLFFIDYQSGRQGPLQYDVASLLFQSTAQIPADAKDRLLEHYLSELRKRIPVNRERFLLYYEGIALLRILQVLATYGRHGIEREDPYFAKSIIPAIKNLSGISFGRNIPVRLNYLPRLLQELFEKL